MKRIMVALSVISSVLALCGNVFCSEDWIQYKFDSRHSGYAPDRALPVSVGLIGAVPLTDACFTSPVVGGGNIYVVDGSGTCFCFDERTLEEKWRFQSDSSPFNCNNVSSPALVSGKYVHFGTTGGRYYVLRARDGKLVRKIDCGEPIFSCPIVIGDRVYFATLGAKVFSLDPDGKVRWIWDAVKNFFSFSGDRWDGKAWLKHLGTRVGNEHRFCCARNIAGIDGTVIVPTGGRIVWLEDEGEKPVVKACLLYTSPSPRD